MTNESVQYTMELRRSRMPLRRRGHTGVQQRGRRPDILFNAADLVIEDISEVEEIARRFV